MPVIREWEKYLNSASLLGDGLDVIAGFVKFLAHAFGIYTKNYEDIIYQTPPIDVLEQDLSLNVTTCSSARRAVKLMISRLSPLPEAQIEWDVVGPFNTESNQGERKKYQYLLGIVRKTDLENWDSLQDEKSSLKTVARHGGFYNFTSSATQQAKRKQTLSGLFLFFTCYFSLLWGLSQWANRPVQIANDWRRQASEIRMHIDDINTELEQKQKHATLIKQYQTNTKGMQILDILVSLTKILPDNAWLSEVGVFGDQVKINGYTDNPAKLAAQMEAKSVITRVQLGTVSADRASGLQRFSLIIELAE